MSTNETTTLARTPIAPPSLFFDMEKCNREDEEKHSRFGTSETVLKR